MWWICKKKWCKNKSSLSQILVNATIVLNYYENKSFCRKYYRRDRYKRCGGTKSFSNPPTAHTNISFPLLWAAVHTLGENKFFIQAFFETPPRIAVIDVFMLKFWYFLNLQKRGKFEIWKGSWWNFKNRMDENICIHLRYKPLPRVKK